MVRYLYLNVNSNPSISWELGMDTKVKTSEIIMIIIIGTKSLRPWLGQRRRSFKVADLQKISHDWSRQILQNIGRSNFSFVFCKIYLKKSLSLQIRLPTPTPNYPPKWCMSAVPFASFFPVHLLAPIAKIFNRQLNFDQQFWIEIRDEMDSASNFSLIFYPQGANFVARMLNVDQNLR